MTLIAHISAYGHPILIGDLLLSSQTRPTKSVSIPIARDINSKLVAPAKRAVVGLTQKLVLLGDRLAFLWSGNFDQARNLIERLQPFSSLTEINLDMVKSAIDAIEPQYIDHLYFIVVIAQSNKGADRRSNFDVLTHRVTKEALGPFGNVCISGSGSDACFELLNQLSPQYLLRAPPQDLSAAAMQIGVAIATEFTGYEAFSTDTISNAWGGGFEFAMGEDGRLRKVGNRLHLLFRLLLDKKQPALMWVPFFQKIDYWHQHLVIRAVQHSITSQKMLDQGREDIFILSPPQDMGSSISLEEFAIPPLTHTTLCCYLEIRPSTEGEVLCFTHYDDAGVQSFRYQFDNNRIRLSFSNWLIETLIGLIRERVGVNAKFSHLGY